MLTFTVPDMSCGHCVKAITNAITALDAQAQITADLESKVVTVETTAEQAAIAAALTEEGYPPA